MLTNNNLLLTPVGTREKRTGPCLSIIRFMQIKSDLPSPPEAKISSVEETNENAIIYTSVACNLEMKCPPSIMLLVASVCDVPFWLVLN